MKSMESSSAPLRVLRGSSFQYFLPFVTFVSFCSDSLLPATSVSAAEIDFEKQVAPVLTANCIKCHNGKKARAGLNLSTREKALKGSEAGEVLVPGKPEESLLVQRAADGSMPPEADGQRLSRGIAGGELAGGAPKNQATEALTDSPGTLPLPAESGRRRRGWLAGRSRTDWGLGRRTRPD
jgi:hypothetical protein